MKCRCKKGCKRFLFLIIIVLLAIQLVPVDRANPQSTGNISAPQEVLAILRRSCFDCHSNETVWPWYSYVAPVSWLVANDVNDGRKHLNFSNWSQYSVKRRNHKLSECIEELKEGEMPLWFYLPLHPEAKLSQEDIDLLVSWCKESLSTDESTDDKLDHDH